MADNAQLLRRCEKTIVVWSRIEAETVISKKSIDVGC